MSTENVKDVVREKYGQAALRAKAGAGSSCCGGAAALEAVLRSDHLEPLRRGAGGRSAGPRAQGLARLRQSHGARRAEAGRDRSRPRLRRRHRRAALGAARRPDRQGLRPRHDGRDARARRGEQAQERPRERRVPEGRDRAHPASRQLGRRDHLELRHQPVGRQGPRHQGSVPRAEARRPIRGVRCRRSRRRARPRSERTWSCGSAAWPARSATTSTWRSSPRPASTTSTSRRRVSTASRTRGRFSPAKASTSTRSPRRSKARSSAGSSARRSRRPRRAAARAAATNTHDGEEAAAKLLVNLSESSARRLKPRARDWRLTAGGDCSTARGESSGAHRSHARQVDPPRGQDYGGTHENDHIAHFAADNRGGGHCGGLLLQAGVAAACGFAGTSGSAFARPATGERATRPGISSFRCGSAACVPAVARACARAKARAA